MSKRTLRAFTLLFVAIPCAFAAGLASGQAYPTKPIRLIAPFPPGGSSDTIARILGQKLSEDWKQRIVVDNRPGASGSIGSGIAAAAPADGYTWVVGSVAPVVLNPLFYKTPYESLRDFVPVSIVASAPQLIVVKSTFPVKSMNDLIALAKSKPGALNFGSSGSGTLPQLGGLMFNTVTGAKITEIPYKGQAPALLDLLAGQVQVVFSDMPVSPALRQSRPVSCDRGGGFQAVPAHAGRAHRNRSRPAGFCAGQLVGTVDPERGAEERRRQGQCRHRQGPEAA